MCDSPPMSSRCLVYGPVPSRRLGLSLGVDLVPRKVCTFDCLYCQLGPTTTRTSLRQRFFDPDELVRQVEAALRRGPRPDVITLAGSGEPTLHSDLAGLVRGLRRVTDLPLALLTNGSLLWDPAVARAAMALDLVAPSLDAADPSTFERLNRPAPELPFQQALDGLRSFCRAFRGTCRLEVMLVRGINDDEDSLRALARLARELGAAAVDLNTVVRPPAHDAARLDAAAMERALDRFSGCRASIIAPASEAAVKRPAPRARDLHRQVLEMLRRRPCTIDDLGQSLGLDPACLLDLCRALVQAGELVQERREENLYYVART